MIYKKLLKLIAHRKNKGVGIYRNYNRLTKNSSQSESVMIIGRGDGIEVNGYHNFYISKSELIPYDDQTKSKDYFLKPLLQNLTKFSTIADIGAGNGYYIYRAMFLGFRELCIIDHDTDYTAACESINNKLEFSNIVVKNERFGENLCQYDVTMFLALIHWVYLCTDQYGEFDPIIKRLAEMTNNVLVIEWVDPKDGAIESFGHLSFNKNKIKEKYSEKNFLNSLSKYFNSYKCVGHYQSNTRKIYIAYKDYLDNKEDAVYFDIKGKQIKCFRIGDCNSLDYGTSDIYQSEDKSLIIKKCRNFLKYGVFERELFWLKRLAGCDFIPKLISFDEINRTIVTKYMGVRLNRFNAPSDWRNQIVSNICKLQGFGYMNHDLKPSEILVNKGKIAFVDFGSVSLNGDYTCGIGIADYIEEFRGSRTVTTNEIIETIERKLSD
jgi:hypothetical protein